MSLSIKDFQEHTAGLRRTVEDRLRGCVAGRGWPSSLQAAVEYSLLAGGKRLRPLLVLLASDLCGGNQSHAIEPACSIEAIHTYSLIHDDLPAMDNDDYRRGRLTSHRVFGEALAILAGDALLTLAFELLAESPAPAAIRADCLQILARAAGGSGMVGGQVLDLEAERGPFPPGPAAVESAEIRADSRCAAGNSAVWGGVGAGPEHFVEFASPGTDISRVEDLNRIHKMKTGALIAVALEMGSAAAQAPSEIRSRLREYGLCIGLAFQIADDLLDVTGDAARLGKTPGRDVDLGKLTYPALMGLENSRTCAEQLVKRACQAIAPLGPQSSHLQLLAKFIVERDH
ncbi:MAG: polyprenyl synthetase family protein [Planctomycetota bacterium]